MDISYWKKLTPQLQIKETNKLFYGKFLYKVKIWCPAAQLILVQDYDKADLLSKRISRWHSSPSYNWAGSWINRKNAEVEALARADQISYFSRVRTDHSTALKFRIEEPNVTIYSNDESLLYEIAKNDPENRLTEVYRPNSSLAIQNIQQGNIVLKKKTHDYKFKIYLKISSLNVESRQKVLTYLDSLGTDVLVIPSCRQNLSKKWAYGSSYFYSKDDQIAFLIQIICPGIISKIYPLVIQQ